MKQTYYQPLDAVQIHYEIKKSEFITRIACIETKQQMKDFVQQARTDYPDARHHCWAYVLGNPVQPLSMASSDDGEPSGTAGKPMLNVLSHKNIGNIGVVIIRYFGGIKLGAGGLVRAYSAATQQAVDALSLELKEPLLVLSLQADFSHESQIRHFAREFNAEIMSVEYSSGLQMKLSVAVKQASAFKACFQAYSDVLIHGDE